VEEKPRWISGSPNRSPVRDAGTASDVPYGDRAIPVNKQRSRAAGGRRSEPLRAASDAIQTLHNGEGRSSYGRPV
jgi:hypothetical protein